MRPAIASLSRAAAVATVVGFAIAVLSGTAIAWSAGGSTWDEVAQGIPMTVPFGAFGLVGALILWRRPGYLVGWVCAGLAGFMAVAIVAMAYGGYDAVRTVEGFGQHLRDETNLDTLADELVGVLRGSVQPSYAAVWLVHGGVRS